MINFIQSYQFISVIGLFADICGVVILFYTGLPFKLPELDSYAEITVYPNQLEKDNKQKKLAYCGLSLLLIGFILQMISSIFSYYTI